MRFLPWLLVLCAWQPVCSQVLQDEVTANFAYQVKQIDEFMERFNNQDNTLIRKYAQRLDAPAKLNRENLIKSLFNASDPSWDKENILRFIVQATDSARPVRLDFLDRHWYAQVDCAVMYRGKPNKLTLILKIQREKNGASKWVAVSALADYLKLPVRQDTTTGLNPLSHATDFMNIDLLATDRKNIRNYLPDEPQNDVLSAFLYESQRSQLTISQVNKITYHFLQVEGWVFTVGRFNRQTRNSGWLINRLLPTNAEEKQRYAFEKLNLPAEEVGFADSE